MEESTNKTELVMNCVQGQADAKKEAGPHGDKEGRQPSQATAQASMYTGYHDVTLLNDDPEGCKVKDLGCREKGQDPPCQNGSEDLEKHRQDQSGQGAIIDNSGREGMQGVEMAKGRAFLRVLR